MMEGVGHMLDNLRDRLVAALKQNQAIMKKPCGDARLISGTPEHHNSLRTNHRKLLLLVEAQSKACIPPEIRCVRTKSAGQRSAFSGGTNSQRRVSGCTQSRDQFH
jgi:hypothetical protein